MLALDIVPDDPAANLKTIDSVLAALPSDIRLVLLPEMCLSGYTVCDTTVRKDLEALALTPARFGELQRMAMTHNRHLWGSASAIDDADGTFRNRGFMIAPDGSTFLYDKKHIFTPGGEGRFYRPGHQQSPVVDVDGWKIKMCICYDLRFPAWNRNQNPSDRYDVLAVVANWPESRAYPWRQLLIGESIVNQSYVLGCNRSGTDMYGDYDADQTAAFDFWGKDISERDTVCGVPVVYATLVAAGLDRARHKFPVLDDADSITLS